MDSSPVSNLLARTLLASLVPLCVASCTGERVAVRVALGLSSDQQADWTSVKRLRATLSGGGLASPATLEVDGSARISSAFLAQIVARFDLALEGLDAAGTVLFRGARKDVEPPADLVIPIRKLGDFARALGSMGAARAGATATVLRDGRVLVVGGADASGQAIATTELFDPESATFTAGPTLRDARTDHAAARLSDGRVVIVGGRAGASYVLSVEIVDADAVGVAQGGRLTVERVAPTATAYAQGGMEKVLVAGGRGPSGPVASCDIYLPSLGTTAPPKNLAVPRAGHAALLVGENILVVGGHPSEARGELFALATETFTTTAGAMAAARADASVTATDQGAVLIAGSSATVERFVPEGTRFELFATLPANVGAARIGPLIQGRALVVGGNRPNGGGVEQPSADAFEVAAGISPLHRSLDFPRRGHSLAAIEDGSLLVVGGTGETTAEIYAP